MAKRRPVDTFGFHPGRILAGKYEVIGLLGGGWEGEVYHVRELLTGIERAAKFFFPERNPRDRAVVYHAKKLFHLRDCPLLIQYLTLDQVQHAGAPVKFLVSELVAGELLTSFLARQPGGRLTVFEGLHLLHTMAAGLEPVHAHHEYHGDLHAGNVLIQRRGISFEVKLIDFYQWSGRRSENIREDIFDIIRIFYDALGGRKHYSRLPPEVKQICCGLKRTLIAQRFRTVATLRAHLETFEWSQ